MYDCVNACSVLFTPFFQRRLCTGQVLEIWQREQVRGAGRSALRPLVNMQDYVHYAQLNNSDIEAALWGWKAAIDGVKTARSWSDPHVAVGHFLRSVETRDGPQRQRFSVAQAIPWPSELDARSRVALAVADAERWRYEHLRADVASQRNRGLFRLLLLRAGNRGYRAQHAVGANTWKRFFGCAIAVVNRSTAT